MSEEVNDDDEKDKTMANQNKQLTPRLIVESVPNPSILVFYLNTQISEYPITSFDAPLHQSSDRYLKQIGELGKNLVQKLFAVPGVTRLTISPYEFHIELARAFDWSDTVDVIVEIAKECFGERKDETDVRKPPLGWFDWSLERKRDQTIGQQPESHSASSDPS